MKTEVKIKKPESPLNLKSKHNCRIIIIVGIQFNIVEKISLFLFIIFEFSVK